MTDDLFDGFLPYIWYYSDRKDVIYMKIHEHISEWMREHGYDAYRMARETGISLSVVYRHIGGRQKISAESAWRYHKITKIPMAILMGEEDAE